MRTPLQCAASAQPAVAPTLYADSTNSVSVCVCPMMLPLMTATAPNSPMARCGGATGHGSDKVVGRVQAHV